MVISRDMATHRIKNQPFLCDSFPGGRGDIKIMSFPRTPIRHDSATVYSEEPMSLLGFLREQRKEVIYRDVCGSTSNRLHLENIYPIRMWAFF